MNCTQCMELLPSMLDRELGPGELNALSVHLRDCSDCCRECALLLCADAAARPRCPDAPEGLWDRVAAALREDAGSGRAEPDVLTLDEAADYLRIGVDDLMAGLEQVPHFRVGEHVRFRRSSVEDWIAREEQAGSRAPMRQATGTAGRVVDFADACARLSRQGRR